MSGLQTQFPFTLPKGYVDEDGQLHRTGVMRLATGRDEIEPLRDVRVAENEAYLTVVMLARVITELGTIRPVTTNVVEGLFAVDLAYLQEFYGIVNFGDPAELPDLEEAYRRPLSRPAPEQPPEPEAVVPESPARTAPTEAAPVLAGATNGLGIVRRPGSG
jgi:hypothetical protein